MKLFKKSGDGARSVQENMIFNTVGSVFYYFCIWITTILIVRMSGYADAGILSIATTVTSGPAIISLFNMRNYQVSDLRGEYSDMTYIRSRVYTNLISFVVCFVLALVYGYGSEPKKLFTILAYMVLKMVEGWVDVYHGIYQKKERMDYAGISFLLRGVASVVSFIVFFQLTKDILIAILSMGIVTFVITLFYDVRIGRGFVENVTEKVDSKKVWKLIVRCTPIAVAAFLTNISTTLPRTYLEQFHGEEVMGYYASVAAPTVVVQLAAMTLFAPIIPGLTRQYLERDLKGFRNTILKFLALIGGLTVLAYVGSILLADPVLRLVFGEEIGPYTGMFKNIIIVAALIALNSCFVSICTVMRIIKPQYIYCIVGVAVSLLVSFTLVKDMGMNGVIIGTSLALLVQILIQVVLILLGVRKIKSEK